MIINIAEVKAEFMCEIGAKIVEAGTKKNQVIKQIQAKLFKKSSSNLTYQRMDQVSDSLIVIKKKNIDVDDEKRSLTKKRD